VQFDYAFHQFGEYTENNTHFFSMSLGMPKKEQPIEKVPIKKKYILSIYPGLENVLFADSVVIRGDVDEDVAFVQIDYITAEASNGKYSIEVPLKDIGKHLLVLKALNKAGRNLEQAKIKVLRLPVFADVDRSYWARNQISFIAAVGLVQGYPDGTFRPNGDITRAEITTMLVRAVHPQALPIPQMQIFSDVPKRHWAASYITEAVRKVLVEGYPDGTFVPGNNIIRAEGVVLISRFAEIKKPKAIPKKPYSDLPANHWANNMIFAAKENGLLEFLGSGPFQAKLNLSRAEAVEILSKTPYAKGKIEELLDFSIGYEE